jgi:thiamine phosphate phosphatase / amino-HMP aminohydrolase
MDEEGRGTGCLTKGTGVGICTGFDKLREMKSVLGDRSSESDELVTTVYIGDSNTDLPCLLHAEVGIIMGNNEDFLATCQRVGIHVSRNLLPEARKEKNTKEGITLYHCKDWNEVINSNFLE